MLVWAVGRTLFVFVLMQKASDLSSQRARFHYVTERACCIEKLTLKLRRNCVPLHDEGCPEAAKDVLFDLGHRPNGDRLSIAGVFRMGVVDRKSTRLNSSHMSISYAVFCLKKKKIKN